MLEKLTLDYQGIRQILRGPEIRELVDAYAGEIGDHVRAHVPNGVVVEVRSYTTDRGAATIAVLDARAMSWQARDGILTRAAAAAGLDVKAFDR